MCCRRHLWVICIPVLLAACTEGGLTPLESMGAPDNPATVVDDPPTIVDDTPPPPEDNDRDQDGLSNDEEATLGTDPDQADTDGDGWSDLEELQENTDPLQQSSAPYTGGWHIGDCHASIQSTGNAPGQIAQDFGLVDQHGETVHLHDFCDRVVLLVSSADWCGSCQQEAPAIQALFDDLEDQGFLPITLLGEGDPMAWANAFGLQHPVLADPSFQVTSRFTGSGSIGLPSMHLLGTGAEVLMVETWVPDSAVIAALP